MEIFLFVALSASQYYFGISAKDLSISQAATLVGILPSPGSFRPDKYPQKSFEKRHRVLPIDECKWI